MPMVKMRVGIKINSCVSYYTSFRHEALAEYLEKEYFQNRLNETEVEDF
jgi:hypothetical protein